MGTDKSLLCHAILGILAGSMQVSGSVPIIQIQPEKLNPTGQNFASCEVKYRSHVCDPDHLLSESDKEDFSPRENALSSDIYDDFNPVIFFLIKKATNDYHAMAKEAMQASLYADENWKLSADLQFMYNIYVHPNNTWVIFGYRSERLADLEMSHQDMTYLAALPMCERSKLKSFMECIKRIAGKFLKFSRLYPGGMEEFKKTQMVRIKPVPAKKATWAEWGPGDVSFLLAGVVAFLLGFLCAAGLHRCYRCLKPNNKIKAMPEKAFERIPVRL